MILQAWNQLGACFVVLVCGSPFLGTILGSDHDTASVIVICVKCQALSCLLICMPNLKGLGLGLGLAVKHKTLREGLF